MKIILFSFFVSSNLKISTFDMNYHFCHQIGGFSNRDKKNAS